MCFRLSWAKWQVFLSLGYIVRTYLKNKRKPTKQERVPQLGSINFPFTSPKERKEEGLNSSNSTFSNNNNNKIVLRTGEMVLCLLQKVEDLSLIPRFCLYARLSGVHL